MTRINSNNAADLEDFNIVRSDSSGGIELGYDHRSKLFKVEVLDNGNIILSPVYTQHSIDQMGGEESGLFRESGSFFTAT